MNLAVAKAASPPEWSAAEWAQRLIERLEQLPADFSIEQVLAVAWALKDACYAAWSSQPQRAGPAAQSVAGLLAHANAAGAWPASAQDELRAVACWTEGISLITSSRMDEAAAALERAATLFSNLGRDDHSAQSLVPRIMALTMVGRHAEAAACAEFTQKEFMRLRDTLSAGKVSLNLGGLQLARDNHRQAAEHYRQAAVLFARNGDIQHSVMADVGLGRALSAMGELEEAMRIYARARMRAMTHALPVLQALADDGVAVLELARGRYREALQGFERTRRNYEELAMQQEVAVAQMQLGEAYLELRLLPEALKQFTDTMRSMHGLGMRDELAWAQLFHARTLAMLHRMDDVEPGLRLAASSFSDQGNAVGMALVTLAQAEFMLATGHAEPAWQQADRAALALRELGQAERAVRADATAALALLELGHADAAGKRLETALERSQELQLIQVQVQCLTGLGRVAKAQLDPALAASHFEAAIQLFEEQRRALPCDEMRSALMADHLRPYQELLRMSLDREGQDGLDVLKRLDHLHARALSERLLQGSRPVGGEATRDLRVRLNWLYRRLNGRGDGAEASPALAAELRRTEKELLERARRDQLIHDGRPDLGQGAPFDPRALSSRLGKDAALVEFGVLDDELFACLVRHDGTRLIRRLAPWAQVQAAVRASRFQIDAMRYGSQALEAHIPLLIQRSKVHLQRLYHLVWEPLTHLLGGCTQVLVVPHGELGAIPFATLHDGLQWLGQRYKMAMVPSAQIALQMLAPWKGQPQSVLAIGDSKHLQHASSEACAVAAMFKNGQAVIDEHATIESMRSLSADRDVIHIACHAEFRRDNPMFSALHLADGPLTAELTEGLNLPGAVVVLSACETGLAGQTSGDELVGLVRAFMVAGASRVMASLWPVDDATTVDFMRRFYQCLHQGLPPGTALQDAQESIRASHPHPFYWAPFVLYGGW